MDKVIIESAQVRAEAPEGQTATMPLADWLGQLTAPRMDTCGLFLPDGVKLIASRGRTVIWVHQTPPRVFNFRWIAPDSAVPFGQETKYRNVRVALPYVIALVVFSPDKGGNLQLSEANECFFRAGPLETDGELSYPALLNCSKYTPPDGRPLSWICTEKLDRKRLNSEPDLHRRMRAGLAALLGCLFETGFNYSSEHHEGSSWFSETLKANVDPRLSSIEAWEAASEKDRLFVLEVPWLKTGLTVLQVVERIFHNLQAQPHPLVSSNDLACLVFNHTPPAPAASPL